MGGSDKSKLWPKDDQGFRILHYCFSEHNAYDSLLTPVETAVKACVHRIGLPAPEGKHALKFVEDKPKDAYPFCFEANRNWNKVSAMYRPPQA